MPCGWEGNRKSGVALAIGHSDFSGLSTYRLDRGRALLMGQDGFSWWQAWAQLNCGSLDGRL